MLFGARNLVPEIGVRAKRGGIRAEAAFVRGSAWRDAPVEAPQGLGSRARDPRHAERRRGAGQTRRRRRVLRRRVALLEAQAALEDATVASGSARRTSSREPAHDPPRGGASPGRPRRRGSIADGAPVSQSSVKCTLELDGAPVRIAGTR